MSGSWEGGLPRAPWGWRRHVRRRRHVRCFHARASEFSGPVSSEIPSRPRAGPGCLPRAPWGRRRHVRRRTSSVAAPCPFAPPRPGWGRRWGRATRAGPCHPSRPVSSASVTVCVIRVGPGRPGLLDPSHNPTPPRRRRRRRRRAARRSPPRAAAAAAADAVRRRRAAGPLARGAGSRYEAWTVGAPKGLSLSRRLVLICSTVGAPKGRVAGRPKGRRWRSKRGAFECK
jgi:hypothetical protein